MARNKMVQEIADRVGRAAEDTLRAVREESKGVPGLEALEQLGREFDAVTVILKRRNEVTNKYEVFSHRTGVLVSELMEKGYELYCKEEGERGEYQVEVIAPPKEAGRQPQKLQFGPFHIGGAEQLPVARSEMNKYGGALPFAAAFGLPTATAGKEQNALTSTMAAMMKQMSESSSNTFQGIMNMMFMEKMMANQGGGGGGGFTGGNGRGGDPVVSELKDEIRQLRSDRDRDRDRQLQEDRLRQMEERNRELERKLNEGFDKLSTKMDGGSSKDSIALELTRLQQQSAASKNDDWLKYMQLMNEASRENQQRFDTLLMKMFEKPGDSEQFSKITANMMDHAVKQLNLTMQLASSGLLGGGGEKSWKDVAGDLLETVRAAFAARYGMAGLEDGEQPLPIQGDQAEVLQQQQQPQALPQPTQQQEQGTDDPEGEAYDVEQLASDPVALKSMLLTSDELDSMSRDRAAAQIFKAIREGDLHQATARIFGLAYNDNSPYVRWIEVPGPLSGQILTHFGMPEHMLAVAENIGEFQRFVGDDGDPNEWSDKYKPIKPKPAKPVRSQLDGTRPDFGLKKNGPPTDIRPVDPSVPPPGVDPELVQRQRAERAARSVAEKMKVARENVELMRAGKLTKSQIAHLRANNLLPLDEDVDQFMAESEQFIAQVEGAAPAEKAEDAPVAAKDDPVEQKAAD